MESVSTHWTEVMTHTSSYESYEHTGLLKSIPIISRCLPKTLVQIVLASLWEKNFLSNIFEKYQVETM